MPCCVFFEPRLRRAAACQAVAGLTLLLSCGWAMAALSLSPPAAVGLDPAVLARIDPVIDGALAAGRMPGCVILVTRHGKTAFLKAYGQKRLEPAGEPMLTDTLFDLASLTKPIATATSVIVLADRGLVRLDDPVARHLAEFGSGGKEKITVFQLLTHQSGLIADNSLRDYADGPEEALKRVFALKPVAEPGSRFIYSDVGFIVLGELVRRLTGKPLSEFSQEVVFGPLRMEETGFLPGEALRRRAAPTEKRGADWMQGEVHDPRAFALGGVAGHAGLFSTAEDLAVFAQMMLGRGQFGEARIFSPQAAQTMTAGYPVPGGLRGLGWDVRSGYSTNRGSALSPSAFGHGGFTGTALWIDPQLDLAVVFLSNRLHPDGKGAVNPIAGKVATIVAESVTDKRPGQVLAGIDVLRRDGFRRLAGRRVGLITNQTGISRDGTSTIQLLHDAPNVELAAIFSPEHGLEGKLEAAVADSRHGGTQLPVYSLYGATRRPTAAMLKGLDTLVFDIQDIGSRFYTYISTMGYAMEAAAEHGLGFLVLDRPNPIGGLRVEGPVLDAGRQSFVGYHRLPIRHGMTVGELARMFNQELQIGADLAVAAVEGWRRRDWFEATGLAWINPSPNMRSVDQAALYPGIGLLETTNLSVGRGTAIPFEVFGAPWLDGRPLAEGLNHAGLSGLRFVAITFTPQASKFRNEVCGGVRILITDRAELAPVRAGLEIAVQIRRLFESQWKAKAYGGLLGDEAVLQALLDGETAPRMAALYEDELKEFLKRREAFLIYSAAGGR
ncbi:MAG: DUF1343 domain-containing protein [Pirellulaceae bacterium]|nr:DUF1343 domain-containing protein [Pirellulaceae bacterium]